MDKSKAPQPTTITITTNYAESAVIVSGGYNKRDAFMQILNAAETLAQELQPESFDQIREAFKICIYKHEAELIKEMKGGDNE
jgi:hypothetical protein